MELLLVLIGFVAGAIVGGAWVWGVVTKAIDEYGRNVR